MPRKIKLLPGTPVPFTHTNQNDPKKDFYWKILRGETTLPESMALLGGQPDSIRLTMDMLRKNDTEDGRQRNSITAAINHKAYMELVRLGEIDHTRLWHVKSFSYADSGVVVKMYDIGFEGPKLYQFNKEWVQIMAT